MVMEPEVGARPLLPQQPRSKHRPQNRAGAGWVRRWMCVLDTDIGCPRQDILIKQPLWDKPLTPGERRGTVPACLLQRFCKHTSAVLAPKAQHELLENVHKRNTWNHKQLLHLCSKLR